MGSMSAPPPPSGGPGRKPEWLKVRVPGGERYRAVRETLREGGLHTVCEEARCPNAAECWESGTATFLLLGETCTRGCGFCAVHRGDPGGALDPGEPSQVATAARRMGLSYAVLTSVTRDDLPDGGASVFAAAVARLKALVPPPLVEVLVPDYSNGPLAAVLTAGPDVLAHNVEVVERLTPDLRHGRFAYRRSLAVLQEARTLSRAVLTKSSLLLGLGETRDEVLRTMEDLRTAGVEILVLGQYLQPTRSHAAVRAFVPPEAFEALAEEGRRMGFGYVAAAPLARTSYRAAEAYVQRLRKGGEPIPAGAGA
ncbi:MAG: lipoyl synthase [Deferrisomatales bacterium]|nr:lipoyl synthase [Deferrisomatales bacterium]